MTIASGEHGGDSMEEAPALKGWLSSRPWAMLPLLTAIGILNLVDRVLPSILAEPIKRDLQLSDTFLGLINGAAFLLIYAVAGLFVARLSDRGLYSVVISASLAIWSLMTSISAFVNAGWQLAFARVGVALGEAGASPAAHAYITRHFPLQRRTFALAIFTMSLPLGSMVGLAVGGYLGQAFGWRFTFLVIGGVGILLAAISYFALPRPDRRQRIGRSARAQAEPPLGLLFRRRSALAIIGGQSMASMGAYAAMAFGPAFIMREYGMNVGATGARFGLYLGLFGIVLLMVAGWASDRLAQKDMRWLPGLVALMILGAVPASVAAVMLTNPDDAIIAFALVCALPAATTAPCIAALHYLVPVELRARSSAVMLFSNSVFGSIGPLLVGALSDALQAGGSASALGTALLVAPASFLVAVPCFLASLRSFNAEVAENNRETGLPTAVVSCAE